MKKAKRGSTCYENAGEGEGRKFSYILKQAWYKLDKFIISQISTLKSHMPTPKKVTVTPIWVIMLYLAVKNWCPLN